MLKLMTFILLVVAFMSIVTAGEVSYREHIKPLWDKQCATCHDSSAPYYGEFKQDKKNIKP